MLNEQGLDFECRRVMKFRYKHIDHNWIQGVYFLLELWRKEVGYGDKSDYHKRNEIFHVGNKQIEYMSKVFHAPSASPYDEITSILKKLKLWETLYFLEKKKIILS